jgi:hypothetical protein
MLLQAFYMESIDEIDTVNLPQGEVIARKIAKNSSLIPTFIIYAIFLPILMIVYYCNHKTGEMMHNFIFHFILKPIRWTFYQILYFLCNSVRKLA